MPFGGKYRIIDFPLSNCVNSGVEAVGILTQYQPLVLNEYIGNGQPWDLDLNSGGVFVLPPSREELLRRLIVRGSENAQQIFRRVSGVCAAAARFPVYRRKCRRRRKRPVFASAVLFHITSARVGKRRHFLCKEHSSENPSAYC